MQGVVDVLTSSTGCLDELADSMRSMQQEAGRQRATLHAITAQQSGLEGTFQKHLEAAHSALGEKLTGCVDLVGGKVGLVLQETSRHRTILDDMTAKQVTAQTGLKAILEQQQALRSSLANGLSAATADQKRALGRLMEYLSKFRDNVQAVERTMHSRLSEVERKVSASASSTARGFHRLQASVDEVPQHVLATIHPHLQSLHEDLIYLRAGMDEQEASMNRLFKFMHAMETASEARHRELERTLTDRTAEVQHSVGQGFDGLKAEVSGVPQRVLNTIHPHLQSLHNDLVYLRGGMDEQQAELSRLPKRVLSTIQPALNTIQGAVVGVQEEVRGSTASLLDFMNGMGNHMNSLDSASQARHQHLEQRLVALDASLTASQVNIDQRFTAQEARLEQTTRRVVAEEMQALQSGLVGELLQHMAAEREAERARRRSSWGTGPLVGLFFLLFLVVLAAAAGGAAWGAGLVVLPSGMTGSNFAPSWGQQGQHVRSTVSERARRGGSTSGPVTVVTGCD